MTDSSQSNSLPSPLHALRKLRRALRERSRAWALRRQGRDAAQLMLTGRRIYILPTTAGVVYAVMLVTMLAGAMNYNNNLAFALTFLLAGIGIVTIYHTHRTLAGLEIRFIGAEPVFAGDPAQARIALVNDSKKAREEIFLDWSDGPDVAGGLAPRDTRTVTMALPTERRGLHALPALRLAARAPLGLMRAWAWVHFPGRCMVYPRPAARGGVTPRSEQPSPRESSRHHGDDDFAGLRAFQTGDSPRRIAWKSYAKTGELHVREFRGGTAEEPIWIDWSALPFVDLEAHVALIARLVLDAFDEDRTWGLRVPGTCIEPGRGAEQLHRCLRALATVGLSPGDPA